MTAQRLKTPMQHSTKLSFPQAHGITIYHPIKGSENRAADAPLSRLHEPDELNAITSCQPQWLTDIVAGYSKDTFTQN